MTAVTDGAVPTDDFLVPEGSLKATAHHEAGHAVVSRHLGVAVKVVSIVAEGDSLGHTKGWPIGDWFRPAIEVDSRTLDRIERQIMLLWAGPLAEDRFTGEFNTEAAQGDFDTITNLALYVSGGIEEAEAFIEWLRVRALGVLGLPGVWPRVDRLAVALLETPRITRRKLNALLDAPTDEESEGLERVLSMMRRGQGAPMKPATVASDLTILDVPGVGTRCLNYLSPDELEDAIGSIARTNLVMGSHLRQRFDVPDRSFKRLGGSDYR